MKYFTYDEFESPDLQGSGINMKPGTLEMLDKARGLAGIPFKINSGYRTKMHNKKVGGKPNSAHTTGYAADIHCIDSMSRLKIIDALIEAKFNRIGIAKTFIHCDNDPNLPQNVMWLYT